MFEYFVKDTPRLLVRTNAGLMALDADSLKVRWERRRGGGVSQAHGPSLDNRIWWIGHSGIVAIPPDDSHAPLSATLRSAQARIDSGYALALDGRSVTVIALPGARQEQGSALLPPHHRMRRMERGALLIRFAEVQQRRLVER